MKLVTLRRNSKGFMQHNLFWSKWVAEARVTSGHKLLGLFTIRVKRPTRESGVNPRRARVILCCSSNWLRYGTESLCWSGLEKRKGVMNHPLCHSSDFRSKFNVEPWNHMDRQTARRCCFTWCKECSGMPGRSEKCLVLFVGKTRLVESFKRS